MNIQEHLFYKTLPGDCFFWLFRYIKYIETCLDIVIKTSECKIGFAYGVNFENRYSEKFIKISEISKENICGGVLL